MIILKDVLVVKNGYSNPISDRGAIRISHSPNIFRKGLNLLFLQLLVNNREDLAV